MFIDCPKLKKSGKSIGTGNEVLAELDKVLGHAFLNAQAILQEVNNSKAATSQAEEKNLVTLMRQAKHNLKMQPEMQRDAEKNLLTTNLQITWAQLLLESSQEALNIILQDIGHGRLYSPIQKFFPYLERLDERINVSMRHRQAGKAQGRSKDSHRKEGKQNDETYGGGRSLRSDVSQDGCGVFCSDGSKHYPNSCPKVRDESVTGGLLKKKGYCSCCIREKKKCSGGSIKNKAGTLVKFNCASCNKHNKFSVHKQCSQRQDSHDGIYGTPKVAQPRGLSGSFGPGVASPPMTVASTLPVASVTELRTSLEVPVISNPNAIGSASELVDICVLEGPIWKAEKGESHL